MVILKVGLLNYFHHVQLSGPPRIEAGTPYTPSLAESDKCLGEHCRLPWVIKPDSIDYARCMELLHDHPPSRVDWLLTCDLEGTVPRRRSQPSDQPRAKCISHVPRQMDPMAVEEWGQYDHHDLLDMLLKCVRNL
ncbi:hypothetical protein PG994_000722 [Apiospora phragmitis]|uniref:Uncharacterized protein n=1 Tax=Apiospora phragmitis TaxID=2905665 RepID=A0ABR1X7B2_9PEZI